MHAQIYNIIGSIAFQNREETSINYDVAYTWVQGHSLVKDTNRITLMTET